MIFLKPIRPIKLGSLVCALLLILFMTSAIHPRGAWASNSLDRMIGEKDGVMVTDSGGKVLFAKNEDNLLVPASVLKILTSLAAIQILGADYRFQTEFYLDGQANLKIKGYGDPLLISETLPEIADKVGRTVKRINDLVLDDTYFKGPVLVPGAAGRSVQPYDAPNGALCVNFNTVNFRRMNDGSYVSAEPQTPVLPFVLDRIKASGLSEGRIILLQEKNEFVLYAGHLFSYFFKQAGIRHEGGVRGGRVDGQKDRVILRHASRFSMEDIVRGMLVYSNNFTANQLLIAAGAEKFGPPGTVEKGVLAVLAYAESQLGIKGLQMDEGSGLSRGNRMSARMMVTVLGAFEPYYHLMREEGREYYKTGTLTGIHTRAGYIKTGSGERVRFAVLVNTRGKSTGGIMREILARY